MEQLPVNNMIFHVAHATGGRVTSLNGASVDVIRDHTFSVFGMKTWQLANYIIVHDEHFFMYLKNRGTGVVGQIHLIDELPSIASVLVNRAKVK